MYAAKVNGQTVEAAAFKRDPTGKPIRTPDDAAFLPKKDGRVVLDDTGLGRHGWRRLRQMTVPPGHVKKDDSTRRIVWQTPTVPVETWDTWTEAETATDHQLGKPVDQKQAENDLLGALAALGVQSGATSEEIVAAYEAAFVAGNVPALHRAALALFRALALIPDAQAVYDDLPPAPHVIEAPGPTLKRHGRRRRTTM